jgi:hypothetical protein
VEARHELIDVLREARAFLALPGNDFAWSSWEDARAALAELDRQIAAIERRGVTAAALPRGPVRPDRTDAGSQPQQRVGARSLGRCREVRRRGRAGVWTPGMRTEASPSSSSVLRGQAAGLVGDVVGSEQRRTALTAADSKTNPRERLDGIVGDAQAGRT